MGGGPRGAMAPPDFADIEKREEIENLLVVAPPDFWTFRRLWNPAIKAKQPKSKYNGIKISLKFPF